MPIWWRLFRQAAERPVSRVRVRAGRRSAARMPMMAMTTSNSINVKASLFIFDGPMPRAASLIQLGGPLHLMLQFLEQGRELGLGLRRTLAVIGPQPDCQHAFLKVRAHLRRAVGAIGVHVLSRLLHGKLVGVAQLFHRVVNGAPALVPR